MRTGALYGLRAAVLCLVLAACEDTVTPLDLNGPPALVTAVAGNGQTGAAGGTLATPLEVIVTDAEGLPVPAVPVFWTATAGTLSSGVDSTDNDGRASVSWTLPGQPGQYQVLASVGGVGSVTFTADATPPGGNLVFRYLDAGSYHSCGIATDEKLYCWGYNGDGQLGGSPSEPVLFPTEVVDVERYRLVSGGRYHSCGITLSGEVSCWGESKDGRLGQRSFPTTFQFAQSGYVHSCALSLSREVWCWGYHGECELGNGGCTPGAFSAVPVFVDSLFKAVTVYGLHSCGIKEDRSAWCWGFNAEGQTGTGTGARVDSLPRPVAGGIAFRTDPTVVPPAPDPDFPLPDGPFIAAGYAHTCAIGSIGATHCWGLNENGQLGRGSVASSPTPVGVSGGAQFTRITAGHSHTCGLTSAGTAYCWGDNTFGQIGDGTRSAPGTNSNDRLAPTQVAGGLTFAYLKAGELHTCGVTTTGVAYCWGDNEYGQLGNGTTTGSLVPSKVAFQP